jgi:hypothetical protein
MGESHPTRKYTRSAHFPITSNASAPRDLRDQLPLRAHHPRVLPGHQTHRPIRSEHAALDAEARDDVVDVRLQRLLRPRRPVRFRDQAADLATHVRRLRQLADLRGPRFPLRVADLGLAAVVEDEAHVGSFRDEFDRRWQLARVDEDVVGEVERGELADAVDEIVVREEAVVGFGLRDVADADGFRVAGEIREVELDVGLLQVDPANDAAHERRRAREVEQEAVLVEALPRLDRDTAVEALGLQQRLEIDGQEVLADAGHGFVDPRVVARVVLPEVLVRVDAHAVLGAPAISRRGTSRSSRP